MMAKRAKKAKAQPRHPDELGPVPHGETVEAWQPIIGRIVSGFYVPNDAVERVWVRGDTCYRSKPADGYQCGGSRRSGRLFRTRDAAFEVLMQQFDEYVNTRRLAIQKLWESERA